MYWGGVKFFDFVEVFGLEKEIELVYVGLEILDKGYYVGIDMLSVIYLQIILCYEMNGKVFLQDQGFLLWLIIFVKYGIKYLK